MGAMFRAFKQVGWTCLAILWMVSAAYAQTAEQLRQLENLTPAQRAAILEELEGKTSEQEVPTTEPAIVIPRRVEQRPFESTEVADDEGLPGLSETAADESSRPELRPFGYDLFAGEPSTFAPATDIPVPVDYVIGPGDTIQVQLFGGQNAQHNLVVTREGILNFPEIGPVSVAGLRFDQLQQTLQQRVREQMIGVTTSITMGALRSIRVFVLGDAHRPGSYTVSALSTMTNALFVSGGISMIGSLRNVQLKRNGNLVTTLDLYDLLLRGDTSDDARLQPGDVIFIPPVSKTVGVDGEVRRPAIYELKREGRVGQVLMLAGGMLPSAYPQASQIDRISAARERTIIDVDLSEESGLAAAVRADDTIRVYSVLEKREDIVVLRGHVYRPGGVQWQPAMRLSDLIPSTNELQPRADTAYVLIRREIDNNQRVAVESVDLSSALAAPRSEADIALQPRDQVIVFELGADRDDQLAPILSELRLQASSSEPSREVAITGRVRVPGNYPLESGMRVSDLIRAGGQLQEAAYALEAELTRYSVDQNQSRKTEMVTVNLARILVGDSSADILLAPHDVLNIKEIPLWRDLEQIEVIGEVRFPGTYPIRRGERLSSVIERAGGLTDLAFANGAVFLRDELRIREQQQLEELTSRLEGEIESAGAANDDSAEVIAARKALLEQVRETKAMGRLVIDLNTIVSGSADRDADVALQDGDRLLVPKESQTVTVIGEVQFPTSHIFDQQVSRNGYVELSGGLTADADKRRVYVVHADGSVEPSRRSMFFRSRDTNVQPGDTIVAPIDADRMSKLGFWTSVTTIIYNIGVAAAAVSSF